MFLLPSLGLGLLFAILLGGRLERLLEVRLRRPGLVVAALLLQVALFSRVTADLAPWLRGTLHILSYVLLIAFVVANARVRPLLLLSSGLVLNAAVIAANSGRMPVARGAARAAGIVDTPVTNVAIGHGRLSFLGDIFALPRALPLTNVFSVGDLLIGAGMIMFVVLVTLGDDAFGDLRVSRIAAPLRVRAYRRLATGKLVSCAGDWLTMTTLVGWTYARTGSTGSVALLMLVRMAPPILGGGVAAFVVDRLPKERLIVWIEVARGATVVLALAGVVTHRIPIVYVALGLSGALATLGRTAVPALVPSLLPREQLASANSSLGVAEDLAMAVGALLAGVALGWAGTVPALSADLGSFLVAAVLFSTIRVRAQRSARAAKERPENGVRYLFGGGRVCLLLLIASFAAATLATGLVSVTLPRLLDTQLGLGVAGYGFGFGALSIGLALGQGIVGFARVGDGAGRWIGLGLATMGGMFFLVGLSTHAPTVLLLLGAAGFVDGTTDVVFKTIVQREADPRHYGAVFGVAGASMRTTFIVAILAAPLANRVLDPRHVIVAASVVLFAAAAIALVSARRRPAEQPAQAVAAA